MIQFNLLPDVKLEYLRVRRLNRLVFGTSLVAAAASLLIFSLLFLTAGVLQKNNINDLTEDIKQGTEDMQSTKDIGKIVTVQNQLKVLPGLHDQKFLASRIFGYIQGVTPTSISISELESDFMGNTMSISGAAATLDAVNTYVDTLKFTTFSTGDAAVVSDPAFKDVVLSEFSRSEEGAKYTITLSFDPAIFSVTKEAKLTVPKKITTRSQTEKPTEIFQTDKTKTNTDAR